MIHYANPIDRSKVSLSISPFKFNAAAACIGSARAVGFESMEIGMTKREWTDIPADVHEALRKVKWFLELVGRRLNDEAYADEGNRAGLAIDCSFVADDMTTFCVITGCRADCTHIGSWNQKPKQKQKPSSGNYRRKIDNIRGL